MAYLIHQFLKAEKTESTETEAGETVAAEIPPVNEDEVIPPEFTIPYTLAEELRENVAPRHIFIFLDGTWNEERTSTGLPSPTNVLRMYQELNHKTDTPNFPSDTPQVIARYYRGVGNRQDNTGGDQYRYAFSAADEEKIRGAALAGLYRDYKSKKDSIYIIGFSRGAASARLLAREICLKGLPPKLTVSTMYHGNLLTGQIEPRTSRVERIGQESEGHKVRVAFLGCWDTVYGLGLPLRFPQKGLWNNFLDGIVRTINSIIPRGEKGFRGDEHKIPKEVDKAVHCVAIDETRNEFLPSLMPHADNVEEVWFPGVHSDVGGGYDDNKLARAPYQFMKSRLIASVKTQNGNAATLFKTKRKVEKKISYRFHFYGLNTGIGRMKNLIGFGKRMRRIRVLDAPADKLVKPKIHISLKHLHNSSLVFAADHKDKLLWIITYDPYNLRELRDNKRDNNSDIEQDDHFEYAYDNEKLAIFK